MAKTKKQKIEKETPELRKKRQSRFLKAYAQIGVISVAAKAAQVKLSWVYRWKKDPKFIKKMDRAFEQFVDMIEYAAINRGLEKSDTLLLNVLRANRPEKYGPKIDLKNRIELDEPVQLIFSPAEVGEADVVKEDSPQDTED